MKNTSFTKRQTEILQLLIKGHKQKVIGLKLKISEKTVAEQIRRMREKAKIPKNINLYAFVTKATIHHSVTKVYTYK